MIVYTILRREIMYLFMERYMYIDYLHYNFEIKETKLQMSILTRYVDISK